MRLFSINHSLEQWRVILAGNIVILFLSVTASGCQSIEVKNQRLAEAQSRLLANPQDKTALSQVVEMLRSDSNYVARANAAATLGTVAEKNAAAIKDAAVPALMNALERDDLGVRDSSARALVKFGPLAKDAIPVLRRNLVPSDTSVAWFSAEALGAMGEWAWEAVPDLVKVIEANQKTYVNDSAHICDYATTALGKIGPPARDAVPSLVELLHHKNPYLRARLAVAIIRIDPNNREPFPVLEDLLKDQDVQVRRVTMWSLGDSGKAARPARGLIEASLTDPDESVRTAASKLLEALNVP